MATALSPSIVETYSRLLVFSEMESLGIKVTDYSQPGWLEFLPMIFVLGFPPPAVTQGVYPAGLGYASHSARDILLPSPPHSGTSLPKPISCDWLICQAHYRLSLLTHLHQLAAHNILNNHAQLQVTSDWLIHNKYCLLIVRSADC